MSSILAGGRSVLLIGASGQLGGEFRKQLQQYRVPLVTTFSGFNESEITASGSPENRMLNATARKLDVRDHQSLLRLIDEVAPGLVINASAYTAVDQAESDSANANLINAIAPKHMAERCAVHGAILVHFSTDYVFDGRATRAYTEQDPAQPLNEYGRSKLRGERAVLQAGAGHFVFRTSWLYTPGGRNFVSTMLRLFRGRDPVRVVDDQSGCPTWARQLACVTVDWLMGSEPTALAKAAGLYHLCSGGQCSWYVFADAIRSRMSPAASAKLLATDSASFGAAAARPARSALDCSRAEKVLKLELPHWKDALDAAMPAFNEAITSGR